MRYVVLILAVWLPVMVSAQSGLNALNNCIAEQTTGAERKAVARMVYVAMSQHPDFEGMGAPSPQEQKQALAESASVFVELLNERCRAEAKKAYNTHGSRIFQASGKKLGILAMQEINRHPKVKGVFRRFGRQAKQALGDDAFFGE